MTKFEKLFILFLAFLGIKDLGLGGSLLFNLNWLLEKANMSYSADVEVLASFFGICALILSTLCVLAIYWCMRGQKEGIVLGKFIGWWMVVASVVVYLKIDRFDYSIIDFSSGILILIPGYLLKNKG